MDKATEKRERQTLGEQMQSIARSGTEESISAVAGEPKRVWVDETVEKGRVIAGYFDVRNIQ
ncbi:MAG: hypothetical protein HYU33_06360 [Candidatus Omnitrophica bacterium]|nr:hypothetical protein [Candidatus Omnitrophota bacterium]